MKNFLSKLFKGKKQEKSAELERLQEKFGHFRRLLEANIKVLKTISDMEEKVREEFLFDMNYIRSSLDELRAGVQEIIHYMIELGGEEYLKLEDRFHEIDDRIAQILPGSREIVKDHLTIPISALKRRRSWSVGGKNAHLGEMKTDLELPVPDGFAITAWAYREFLEANKLQKRITERIDSLNISHIEELNSVSEDIREMILQSEVPPHLTEAIENSHASLSAKKSADRFSMRSSAIGEDTQFSFAGQYATFLNVKGRDIVEFYPKVVASKFTPKAIYYFLAHSLNESELAMSVGCFEMIESAVSGVVYSRNPINTADNTIVISAIYGLGRYLVDGVVTPDTVWVARDTLEVIDSHVVPKLVRLVLHAERGTCEEAVPRDETNKLAIPVSAIEQLCRFAVQLEEYYGTPQDIEWALDKNGELFLLQTRPLRVVEISNSAEAVDTSDYSLLLSGGETVCPGAGSGAVFHLESPHSLINVPPGSVVVANHSFPGMVTVMESVSALVTEIGSVASHMATLSREYHLPTLVGISGIEKLKDGEIVTVDATGKAVYAGEMSELISSRGSDSGLFDDMAVMKLMQRLLVHISPLNLINPHAEEFTPENCVTFHDLTRYSHQLSMMEMFSGAQGLSRYELGSIRLKTEIPLKVQIVLIEPSTETDANKKWIPETEIPSVPMQAFWDGLCAEGWPSVAPPPNLKGFTSVMTTHLTATDHQRFEESSFAVLSPDYMVLSLRLGYHFTTIEAMCTGELNQNYIRFQHKGGGASLDRRVHRVQLIKTILTKMGFTNQNHGDFLDSKIAYQDSESLQAKLRMLGRLTMKTKQLDMALTNESITKWYADDILQSLGL